MVLGNALIIYFSGVGLLLIFALLIIANFQRYRFVGDKTLYFILFTAILFFLTVVSTILITRTSVTNNTTTTIFQ